MKALHLLLTFTLVLAPAARAATITYVASLSGPNESPANASPGTGSAVVIINTITNMMEVTVQFQGLTANTTASHIHCCTATPFSGTAGVATQTPTFTGFPLGVTSGTYDRTFDLTLATTYNPAFIPAGGVAAAESNLLAGIAAGDSYLNIHTTAFPSGEIRGFLVAAPEPSTFLIAGTVLSGLILRRRSCRRNRKA
jgi:hypothetical protein